MVNGGVDRVPCAGGGCCGFREVQRRSVLAEVVSVWSIIEWCLRGKGCRNEGDARQKSK